MTDNEFVHYDHYQSTVINYVDSATVKDAGECVGEFQEELYHSEKIKLSEEDDTF